MRRLVYAILCTLAIAAAPCSLSAQDYCLYRCYDTLGGGYCGPGQMYTACEEYPECPNGSCQNMCNGSGWEFCI